MLQSHRGGRAFALLARLLTVGLILGPACPGQSDRPGDGNPGPQAVALPYNETFGHAPFSVALAPEYAPPAQSWIQVKVIAANPASRVTLRVTGSSGDLIAECTDPAANSIVLTCRAPADEQCTLAATELGEASDSYALSVWQPQGEMSSRPPYGPGGQAPLIPTCMSPAP